MDILQYKKESRKSWVYIPVRLVIRPDDPGKVIQTAYGHTPVTAQDIMALRKASGGKITISGIAGIKRKQYQGNGYVG
jgi:hypothetical protein